MKKLIFTLSLLIATLGNYAQTAVDFTLTDCNSVSQHLYSILDQNKIVALDYEHQCSYCFQGTSNLSTVLKTFYNGDPNIIVMYLDNGGNSCFSTTNWVTVNNFVQGPCFEYSSNFSSPYGSGMPVIVIAAGIAHKTFLVANGAAAADTASIHNAIKAAYTEITGIENNTQFINPPDIFFNPASHTININFQTSKTNQNAQVMVYDMKGQMLLQQLLRSENTEIDISHLAKGAYMVKLEGLEKNIVRKIIIE